MEQKWNFEKLFDSDQDPRIEEYRLNIQNKVKLFVEKWIKNEEYMEKPEVLKQALDEYSLLQIVGPGGEDGAGTKDAFYFWLRMQQEQSNHELKAKYSKAIDFATKLANELKFFKINLGKINANNQKIFIESNDLSEYKHFIKRCFDESKYTLDLESEKILSLKQKPAHEMWDEMLSKFLSKEEGLVIGENGQEIVKNFSEIISLLSNPSKKIRDSAAKSFNEILKKFSDVAESEINAILENKRIDDELRKAARPDSMRHLSDDLDSEIVDSLIDSVSSNFNLSKKIYELKSKLLGLEKLEYHERNVVYGKMNKKYPYEESLELVKSCLSELDSEFGEIFSRLIQEGQVDAFASKGKRQGAFCTDSLLYQPTYILLNHNNELRDVLTIAHEMGHAINSELMKSKCNTLSCGMILSTAEVASTFMEDFVFQRLMKEADEEEKLSLMVSKLSDDVSTIIRQVACYKFEKELHEKFREKGYLSKEEIGKIFQKNMFEYMGDHVNNSEENQNWWIYWHHIRNFFYVYSYASGLLISKYMQKKVKKNPEFIQKVKEFLSTGTSKSPKETFMQMGIDISKKEFWDSGIKEIEELLFETEKLAKKLGKI